MVEKWLSRGSGEKAKQNGARNNAKCSTRLSFYAIIAIKHSFFNALTFARYLARCCKPRPATSVFNTFFVIWQMLMHKTMFNSYISDDIVNLSGAQLFKANDVVS